MRTSLRIPVIGLSFSVFGCLAIAIVALQMGHTWIFLLFLGITIGTVGALFVVLLGSVDDQEGST